MNERHAGQPADEHEVLPAAPDQPEQVRRGRVLAEQAAQAGIELWTGSTVWGVFPGRVLGIDRAGTPVKLTAGRLVIATGAHDRTMAFPGWTLIDLPRQGRMDATTIRDAYFGATPATVGTALAPLAGEIPPSTIAMLEQFAQTPHYPALQEEWRMLRGYREAWAAAPYPPVFVTVDAVLRCQDQVLLIRRAHAPGKGQLAVPGGFIEQRETVWQSCLRELVEETHCQLSEATMRAALQSVAVFETLQARSRSSCQWNRERNVPNDCQPLLACLICHCEEYIRWKKCTRFDEIRTTTFQVSYSAPAVLGRRRNDGLVRE